MDLDDLLQKTSRTFAVAIPLLPEPTRNAVALAYLLFRVADTFEDATLWTRDERITALHQFARLFELDREARALEATQLVSRCTSRPPIDHQGYLELLSQLSPLLDRFDALEPSARAIVAHHVTRTSDGMGAVVRRADERGNLSLTSLHDLKSYCYLVAGIVGELLTELFLNDCPALGSSADALRASAVAFGEGLQLVNILKDSGADASDGRVYLPPQVSRAEVLSLAWADLEQANRYVQTLQHGGAPRGFVAFTGLALVLAFASLDVLRVRGAGAKVSRDDVGRLFAALHQSLDEDQPFDALALISSTALRARAS
ncbi:MAG: squalene/phytoene synthase family protein [Myxococcales bacterium]|nr:squalene/phytoene synthase family protein [Myxococcales bacterium]